VTLSAETLSGEEDEGGDLSRGVSEDGFGGMTGGDEFFNVAGEFIEGTLMEGSDLRSRASAKTLCTKGPNPLLKVDLPMASTRSN